jgi:hypothetical protein
MILNVPQSIASRSFEERVRLGKQYEAQMLQNLIGCGYQTKSATSREDMIEKIDGYIVDSGTAIPFQSKYRETGSDIGLDIYEPWFGLDDPRTRLGRDSRGKAELYLTQVETTLYLMSKGGLKYVVDSVMNEWKDLNFKFDFGDGVQRGTFNSRIYSGVQFKFKIDERSGVPKIMAYIPPTAVDSDFCRTFTVAPIKIVQ